jgi:rubrerythrin
MKEPKMTMSLGQAVRNAIETENAAERFYAGLAARTDDGDARHFLEDMSAQEGEHAASLERFAATLEEQAPGSADIDLGVVETGPDWLDDASLSFTEALTLALRSEEKAQGAYAGLAVSCEAPPIRRFFAEMAEAERKHAEQLSDILDAAQALA